MFHKSEVRVVTLQSVVRDAIAAPRFPYSATNQLYRADAPLPNLNIEDMTMHCMIRALPVFR